MISLTPLPPKEAIAFFRSKGLEPSFAWQDVWQQEHARAFTVAKMMSRDLLEATRAAMDKALSEGTTLEQFKKNLKPTLQTAGWWGRQKMTDPLTGEEKLVQLGSDRRLRTIFDMNLRTSYAHGQWQRIERNKEAFPYLMYVTAGDERVRPEHEQWEHVCLPVDHPWWETHFPPCGWRCRCGAIALTRRQAEKQGITDNPPAFPPKVYVNPRTGEVSQLEQGIDPGFNFNVGKAPLRSLSPPPLPPATATPDPSASVAVAEPLIRSFLEAFKATEKGRVIKDRDQWPVAISEGLFRDAAGEVAVPRPDLVEWLPVAAEALARYDSVAWVWAKDGEGTSILIRRYTKRVTTPKPAVVTVDIGREGWTYDVTPLTSE
jgi:SPP1 gp7 family putative phage head morphogenesis protein